MDDKICAKILIIDDDESFCIVTANLLRLDGYIVDYLVNVHESFAYLHSNPETDIVLLDIDLGADINGIEAIPHILEAAPMMQIIMLTSQGALNTGIQCMKMGAYDYLTKPFKKENLFRIVPGALERKKLKQLNSLYLEILVHDLKNPLQSINMGLEVLCNDQIPMNNATREQSKNLIKYGTWQIQNMISNILNVSKFEKYSFPLTFEPFCLEEEIMDNIKYLVERITFTKKQFELINRSKKNYILRTDKGLFNEIIANLIGNAIRFTKAGNVIRIEIDKEKDNLVQIKVTNSGSYIDDEFRDKIFDKFFKSRYSQERQTQNFGLGLTFSKLAVEMLGGTIWVECNKDIPETAFSFTIRNHK